VSPYSPNSLAASQFRSTLDVLLTEKGWCSMNLDNQQLPDTSRFQQRAKQLKIQQAVSENQSLNLAAHESGFSDYQAYLDAVRKQAIRMMLNQNHPTQRSFS
jgi:hypothetical protein